MKRSTLYFLFFVALGALLFTGCRKDIETKPDQPVNSINDLTVSDEFDWKTTRQIELTVSGMTDLPFELRKSIRVATSDGNTVFVTELIDLRQNSRINFTIPTYLSEVLIQCGTIQDTIPVLGNTMQFNLINN